MPNQRKKGKTRFGFWITEAERDFIEKDMKKLGITNYSDYIKHKLDLGGVDKDDRESE